MAISLSCEKEDDATPRLISFFQQHQDVSKGLMD